MKHYDLIVCDFPAKIFLELSPQIGLEWIGCAFSSSLNRKELSDLLRDSFGAQKRLAKTKTIFAVPKELDECPEVFRSYETHYLYFLSLDKETLQKQIDRIKTLSVFS
jgi:hypothetical protein